MKITFDRDILRRKIRKNIDYFVLSKDIKDDKISYIILNDGKDISVITLFKEKNSIFDSEYLFHESDNVEFYLLEKESEKEPPFSDLLLSENKYFYEDLLRKRCWAITDFSKKLTSKGIEVSDEYKQIAFQDVAKMTYVQGEMNALFLGVCNFFAGCANMQFVFRFDKHNKKHIDLLTLANTSYNRFHQTADDILNLKHLEGWQQKLKEKLYASLTIYSDFGDYIQNNDLYEDRNHERACLKSSIQRIILTISSLFIYKNPIVYQLPLKEVGATWDQYCLIFETDENYYRFYLGNYD